MHPINSIFIFNFIKYATKQKSYASVFRRLHLEATSSGRRFKEGLSGKCWWPKHEDWYANLWCKSPGLCRAVNQEFPIMTESRIVQKKEEANESKQYSLNREDVSQLQIPLSEQWTLESCVYEVLLDVFQSSYHNDLPEILYELTTQGEAYGLSQASIREIAKQKSLESVARYLVISAKAAIGTPLEQEENLDKKRVIREWEILRADELDMDMMDVSEQIMKNDALLYKRLPPQCQGSRQHWAIMFTRFSSCCNFVVDPNRNIQGNYSIIGLSREQEQALRKGCLIDSDINIFDCDDLRSKGEHAAYLLNLSVNPSVDIGLYNKLWDSFIQWIKDCAKEGIFFSNIYFKAFLPEHATKALGRGFDYLCSDSIYGSIYLHNMDADTTLRILDEELADIYRARIINTNTTRKRTDYLSMQLDAENAFQSLFREIDEVFLHPQFAVLKPYFFDEMDMTDCNRLKSLGVALAELLRDILQYAESFLEYLPADKRISFEICANQILSSNLVKESQKTYCFTTEREKQSVRKGYSSISPKDILNFAHIWTKIDRLFLRQDLLVLRPFFYESRNLLPPDDLMDIATALTLRILSGMKNAEDFLDKIPHTFVVSYYDYKETLRQAQIVQETIHKYPFIRDELGW